jgi:hypothetical protein
MLSRLLAFALAPGLRNLRLHTAISAENVHSYSHNRNAPSSSTALVMRRNTLLKNISKLATKGLAPLDKINYR